MIPFSYLALVEVDTLSSPAATSYGAVQREWDLTAGVPYSLVSYAPAVAPLRRSRLGGDGAYGDVLDTIVVDVFGDCASDCVAAYESLVGVVDQAARWARLEAVNAIQVRAQVRGGVAGELAAVLLGAAPGDQPATPSPEFDEAVGRFVIRGVELRTGRRGAWLVPTPDSTSASVTTGEVASLTFPAASDRALHPVELRITSQTDILLGSTCDKAGFLLFAPTGNIGIANASAYTNVPTGVAVVGGLTTRNGSVARYTPPDTNAVVLQGYVTGLPVATKRAHLFASVRNAASAYDYLLSARLRINASGTVISQTTPIRIPANPSTYVQVVYIGQVDNINDDTAWPLLDLIVQSGGTGGGVLDIGTIVCLGDTGEASGVLRVSDTAYAPTFTTVTAAPRALSALSPTADSRRTTGNIGALYTGLPVLGDRYPQLQGTAMDVCAFFASDATQLSTFWRPSRSSGATPHTITVAGVRQRAYRVPQ